MKACLTTDETSPAKATQRAAEGEGVIGMDYVREVTAPAIYQWDPDDRLSQFWSVTNGNASASPQQPLPPARFHIVAYDYGMKENILRRLRQNGFRVTVVPATTSAEETLSHNPDGIFLSNGPAIRQRWSMRTEHRPRIGRQKTDVRLCLGHQLLGLRSWRCDLQTEIWTSRRQPTGLELADRQGRDHFAKSWLRGRARRHSRPIWK